MKYIVYEHVLKKDNRKYIGITKQNPQKRWQNGLGYSHSIYFFNAIKKYGWDNFKHNILYKDLTKEEAEKKEIELIKKFKTNIKGFGFNINEGGFAPVITKEQRIKISNSEKGKVVSRETIDKIIKTKKDNFLKYGLTKKQKAGYKKRVKPILCIETQKIYYGQKELKEAGFNVGNISMVCLGKRTTADKYHWKFIEE